MQIACHRAEPPMQLICNRSPGSLDKVPATSRRLGVGSRAWTVGACSACGSKVGAKNRVYSCWEIVKDCLAHLHSAGQQTSCTSPALVPIAAPDNMLPFKGSYHLTHSTS